uniref:Putative extracellular protein CSOL_096 n=1 Tax=Pseudococcomyxa simplex TaxID=464287 RepID=A0A7L9QEJ7_9CHLO|nr:putative extracellular protein CSOL_096 [Pseudococcomyxa simplex]
MGTMRARATTCVSLFLITWSLFPTSAEAQGLTPSEALRLKTAGELERLGKFVNGVLVKGNQKSSTQGPTSIPPQVTSTLVLPSSTTPTLTPTSAFLMQSSTPASTSTPIISLATTPILSTTISIPTSTLPPPTTPFARCPLFPQTDCTTDTCPVPPNPPYQYCGCIQLASLDLNDGVSPGLEDLKYYSCLQNITGDSTGNSAYLTLSGLSNLTTLAGLEALVQVGDLSIDTTPLLQNVGSTLQALQHAQQIGITSVDNLLTIDGFMALQAVDTIQVVSNPSLISLGGFPVLESITGDLFVSNIKLTSIDGFTALKTLGSLSLYFNVALPVIDGFTALNTINGPFTILGDASTTDVLTTISGFTALTSINGPISIQYSYSLSTINGFTALANITSCDDGQYVPGADHCVYINNVDSSALSDISGFATLGQCNSGSTSGDPYLESISVKIVVYPPASVGCTLCSWQDVCEYIEYGNGAFACQQFTTC